MTNEEKAKEISNSMSFCKDRILVGYQSAMEMAKWKDEQIENIINTATANLIATLKNVKIFSDKSIVRCASEFREDLLNKLNN